MAIKINCSLCNKELMRLGGLIFSPADENGITLKYHICQKCFKGLQGTMNRMKELLEAMNDK
jgi:hypothetical protein